MRLTSRRLPYPARSVAPTIVIERGRSSASIAARALCARVAGGKGAPVASAAERGQRPLLATLAGCDRLRAGEQAAGALGDGHVDHQAVERGRGAPRRDGFVVRRQDVPGAVDRRRRWREQLVEVLDLRRVYA